MSHQVTVTPYGAAALDALRDVVRELKGADAMAPVTVVVPTNLVGITARRHLARGLDPAHPAVAGISLTTLPRLAERLSATALHPRRPATVPILAAAWRAELDSGESVFDPVKGHPATVRALVAAHRELRDLDDDGLQGVAGASRLASDLVRLHRSVTQRLAGGWYDATDLLAAATERLEADPTAAELGAVVLFLPQQLTRGEAALAAGLARAADTSVIVGMTGVQRADRVVRRSLERMGLEVPASARKARTASQILHASDSDDEVRCVVREVVSALDRAPASRIAVLYASAEPYARLLRDHLEAAGITVNGAGTRPVLERAIARAFLGLLRLADADLPRDALFAALSEAPATTFDGERVPVSRWERVSRSAAVVRGDDWAQRLTAYREALREQRDKQQASDDRSRARIDALQRDIESAEGLQRFALALAARLTEAGSLRSWAALSAWALRLLADLYGDSESRAAWPPPEQYAVVALESVLRSLAEVDALQPVADLAGLVDAVTLELEAARPRVGRFGDGVLVAPLSESVGLSLDMLYVVGLAEDLYPGRLSEDPLLLERTRERSGGQLPSYRDRLDALHRHLQAAYDAAPAVVASFPRGDLRRSTLRLPSRWLLGTLRELSGKHQLAATEWESVRTAGVVSSPSFALSLLHGSGLRSPAPATEQEWRVRAVSLRRPLGDEVVDAAVRLVAARDSDAFTRFDGNLSGAAGLPDFRDSDRLLSPTALESYAVCPHAYFVQRMLGVTPVERPEELVQISPLDVGTLIHTAMDVLIREFADRLPGYGEPWTAAQRRRLREITLDLAADYERRGATGHRSLWLVERDRILADVADMLDDDDRRRAGEDARVVRSELSFGFAGTAPVEVAVTGGSVRFRGSADKVDERRDGTLLVIDVKTGGFSKFTVIRKDPIAAGTKLQLPVYAQAARQLLHAERAEAAYWFVRRGKREWIEVALSDEVYDVFRRAVDTLVSSIAGGLFPAKAPESADYLWVTCPYCNPDGIGHGDVRARWERKRRDPVLSPLVRLVDPGVLDADEPEPDDPAVNQPAGDRPGAEGARR